MRVAPLLIAGLIAACGSQPPTGSDAGPPEVEGTWSLASGTTPAGPVPVLAEYPITLVISGSELSGTAACNHYGGRFNVSAGGLAIGDLAMTAIGCEEPVAASEAAYVGALQAVTAAARDGEELVLTGPGVELRYQPLPEPPTAELVDTVWVLDAVFVGDVAAAPVGERATLQIRSDGTLSGETGCRAFDGEWVEQGDQILATMLTAGDEACPPDLASQDSHVFGVIGDGFVPTVEANLLTLTDPGGVGLVYRAADATP